MALCLHNSPTNILNYVLNRTVMGILFLCPLRRSNLNHQTNLFKSFIICCNFASLPVSSFQLPQWWDFVVCDEKRWWCFSLVHLINALFCLHHAAPSLSEWFFFSPAGCLANHYFHYRLPMLRWTLCYAVLAPLKWRIRLAFSLTNPVHTALFHKEKFCKWHQKHFY